MYKKSKYYFSQHNFKPFFNVAVVIGALFIIVLFKMELRRMSYAFLVRSQLYGKLQDNYYKNLMIQAKMTRSERLEELAQSRMTLHWAKKGQVVLIIGDKIAISQ